MTGSGVPIAEQGKTAIDFIGKVWLEGPFVMIGGGRSSSDVTVSLPLRNELPAKLTAEQTIVLPLSFFFVSLIVRVEMPLMTGEAWYLPFDIPGRIIVRLPSILQNIVGSGFPDVVHVNIASVSLSAITLFGFKLIEGGSKIIKNNCIVDIVKKILKGKKVIFTVNS